MQFQSLEPFIPSGADMEKSKNLFIDLGFTISGDAGDYIGFAANGCRFILQKYDNKAFAENLMINVKVDDVNAFYAIITEKQMEVKYNIRITAPKQQPYGKEVNLIDIAGVCWHFVES